MDENPYSAECTDEDKLPRSVEDWRIYSNRCLKEGLIFGIMIGAILGMALAQAIQAIVGWYVRSGYPV